MSRKNISCQVIENNGYEFEEQDNLRELVGNIVVKTDSNEIYKLKLYSIWQKAVNYLWLGVTIYLKHVKIDELSKTGIVDLSSYLVLEPEILISPSVIRGTEGCIRKYYIQKRNSSSEKNYNMLKGSLVNNAFDLLIEDQTTSKTEIIETVLQEMLIELASLEDDDLPEPDKIKADLKLHLDALAVWKTHAKFSEATEMTTEPTFISNEYGLSGRLDLLVNPGKEAVTYELKTSKAPSSTKPWMGDSFQVACYQLLLDSAFQCQNADSYVIYSRAGGNDLLKQCSIEAQTRRKVISIRNEIVSIDHALLHDLDKEPEFKAMIPPTESGACEKCFFKKDCFYICSKLNEKDCNSCGVTKICENANILNKSKDLPYYNHYFRLVELERNESRRKFSRIFNNTEIIKEEGKIILNLEFDNIKENILTLKSETVIEAEIKLGDLVLIYNEDITFQEVFKANVKELDRFSIKLSLKKNVPSNLFQGKLWNIYTDTMETTYNTMQGSLFSILSTNHLDKRNLITGRRKPNFLPIEEIALSSALNSRQKYAIQKALSAEDYFLIQGPPGTGKTHTLANLIIELVKKGNKVLLSAFTHRAIDNVLLKLIQEGFTDFLRLGSHEIVDAPIHPYLIQERFNDYSFDEIKKIQKELENYPVVACSSIGANSSALIKKLSFDVAVIDEAGQLTEPGTLSVILQAKKFILVGDHKQLPPVIQNDMAKLQGFSKSLFERLIDINKDNIKEVLVTLEEQYRMNENIMSFSNNNIYNYELKAFEGISKQKLALPKLEGNSTFYDILAPEHNLVFVHLDSNSSFKTNAKEAEFTVKITKEFVNAGMSAHEIGIITPFRAQVAEIRRAFLALNDETLAGITVDTVDRFQGSDRELIIFSSVATSEAQINDFFIDFRRINVSVTRAKKKFILIGNKNVLAISELFYKLIRMSKEVSFSRITQI